jgi:hypothetical protein
MHGKVSPFLSRGLRFRFRCVFRKRRGLALAAPLRLIRFLFQFGNTRLEFSDKRGLFGN